MNSGREILTLAIESAIEGGSISLQKGKVELANRIGSSPVSRAEDLLPSIDILLHENDIKINDLELIAVSSGPGSYTGIRIGIATVLGLKSSLNIRCESVSALEAVYAKFARFYDSNKFIAVLPMGRETVCLQRFTVYDGVTGSNAPEILAESGLKEILKFEKSAALSLHGSIFSKFQEAMSEYAGETAGIINLGYNIAEIIGTACHEGYGSEDLAPLFVS